MAEPKAAAEPGSEPAPAVPDELRRRRRLEEQRGRLTIRLSADELAEIAAAAQRSGLTRSGFVAGSALRAARGVVPVAGEEQLPVVVREATRALDDLGVNLNQAVHRLNRTGAVLATDVVRLRRPTGRWLPGVGAD